MMIEDGRYLITYVDGSQETLDVRVILNQPGHLMWLEHHGEDEVTYINFAGIRKMKRLREDGLRHVITGEAWVNKEDGECVVIVFASLKRVHLKSLSTNRLSMLDRDEFLKQYVPKP